MDEIPAGAGAVPGSLRDFLMRGLGMRDLPDVQLLEYLVGEGKLKRDDIEEFLLGAQLHQRTVSDHIIAAQVATEMELLSVSARLYDMEVVPIADICVDSSALNLIRADQTRNLQVLPYGRSPQGELLVAISDPGHKEPIMRELSSMLPKEKIALRLAPASHLALAIDKAHRGVQEVVAGSQYAKDAFEPAHFRAQPASDSAQVKLFTDLLSEAVNEGASDIHVEPQGRDYLLRTRVDGKLYEKLHVPSQIGIPLIAYIKVQAEMPGHDKRSLQDGSFSAIVQDRRIDMRVVTTPVVGEPGEDIEQAVLRIQDPGRALLTLQELGMTDLNYERFLNTIQQPYGFAVIAGPTGSGKTTTLYAALQVVVRPEVKVISIEDPVELRLAGVSQIEVPRAGDNRWGFHDALEHIVRADPNIIMVGEMRDADTARVAINASLTGHFVYSTLHANSALTTIIRLGELGVEPFLISEALEMVVAQRLVRRVCPKCAETYTATLKELQALKVSELELEVLREQGARGLDLQRAADSGCRDCFGRGYKGRTGIHEVLIVSDEMRQAILDRAPMRELARMARDTGMTSLREDGWAKVKNGITTLEELNTEVKWGT